MTTRLLLTALAAGAAACAAAQFEPTVPMRARSRDVALELETLRLGDAREVVFHSQSSAPLVLRQGWLTVATRAPCTGGAEAIEIVVDGGASPAGVVPAGTHELAVRFDHSLSDFTLDTVVDLALEGGACVRAPAVSQSIPLAARSHPLLTFGGTFDFNADLSGLHGIFAASGGAGGWFGPFLLSGEVALGAVMCNPGLCGRQPDGSLHSDFTGVASVDVRYVLGSGARFRMVNFVFVGARYAFALARLPAPGGELRFGTHRAEAVLSWAFGEAPQGPFRHLERLALAEIYVPAGVLLAPGAPGDTHVTYTIGLGFRFLFPL